MKIRTVHPIVDDQVERKSSINQHKDLLSVLIRGEWCPLVFNIVDGVECGKIQFHKTALRIRPGLNYTFPVGTCKYVKDNYLLTAKDRIELKPLCSYFGSGLYESREHKKVLTNIGHSALGYRQEKVLRVGKDYVVAKKTLKAVE